MKPETEPLYPIAALTATTEAERAKAESGWWNEVLLWGRSEHGKVSRICAWAVTMDRQYQKELPADLCVE